MYIIECDYYEKQEKGHHGAEGFHGDDLTIGVWFMNVGNSEIRIREISDAGQLKIIESLARKIFPKTYSELIPAVQIPYMMQRMYDDAVLRKEFSGGMNFAVITENAAPIGYISWHSLDSAEGKAVRLEKLYLDFACHGRSIGNMGIRHVIDEAERSGASFISLNVHKRNLRAQKAYCRAGFYRWYSEKEDVGNGFFKDDYVMRYDLPPKRTVNPAGFVRAADVVPEVIQDIRYYSDYNFVGRRIDGYEAPAALLTTAAAEALKAVGEEVGKAGYRLKIYDTYRPIQAVAHFMRWIRNPADTRLKADFYPDVDKSELVARGYIAENSSHSRGSTVDLTLYDPVAGRDMDMGGTFDWFGMESHPDWCGNPETGEYTGEIPSDAPADRRISAEQFQNRMRLRSVMMRHGFLPLEQEWWHFTLANEPYPDTCFDFPVK